MLFHDYLWSVRVNRAKSILILKLTEELLPLKRPPRLMETYVGSSSEPEPVLGSEMYHVGRSNDRKW